MSSSEEQAPSFDQVKARLAEIADAVDDEDLSLDDALDLYEEAVALGLQASDLLETGIVIPEENPDSAGEQSVDGQPDQAAAEGEVAAGRADE